MILSKRRLIKVSRTFRFEAAHQLPFVPEFHKCRRMHGHSYRLEVIVGNSKLDARGFVIDFAEIDAVYAPVVARLDHNTLNDYIPNPTAENLVEFFYSSTCKLIDRLELEFVTIRVHETERSYAERTWELVE